MTKALDSSISLLTDEQIVARILSGEPQLYEVVMRRHNQRIYRAARAIVRDDAEAEDVLQDAYCRAYAHLREFEGRSLFSTWLTRIAVNEALSRLRRRGRFQPIETRNQVETRNQEEMQTMPSHDGPSPEQQTSDAEMRLVLEKAIDALPEEFRVVFVLRAIEEMSGAQTAECLGVPEETVKTRLFRARARLKETLLKALEPAAPRAYEFHLSRCDRAVATVLSRLGVARM